MMFWLGLGVGILLGFFALWFVAAVISATGAWLQIREDDYLDD